MGQVNGLSVVEIGGFAFGRPTRITCQARPGVGKVVDIECEVELGGPIHSKGVLILSGFLAGRYALDAPMSLFASLVFEQSYGGSRATARPRLNSMRSCRLWPTRPCAKTSRLRGR